MHMTRAIWPGPTRSCAERSIFRFPPNEGVSLSFPPLSSAVPVEALIGWMLLLTFKHIIADFVLQTAWMAHGKDQKTGEPESLRIGVPQATVDIIKNRKSTRGLPELEAAIIEFGRELFQTHKISTATFARMRKLFEPHQLVDLVLLMGNYTGTALLLAAFDMQVPDGKPLLPVG